MMFAVHIKHATNLINVYTSDIFFLLLICCETTIKLYQSHHWFIRNGRKKYACSSIRVWTHQAAGRKPPHKTTECKRTVETPRDHRQKWIQRWIDDIGLCRFWDGKSQCHFVIMKKICQDSQRKKCVQEKHVLYFGNFKGKRIRFSKLTSTKCWSANK